MSVPSNLIPTRVTQLPEYAGSSKIGFMPYIIDGRTYKVQFSNIATVDLSDPSQTQGTLPLGSGGTGGALSPVAGAVAYSTASAIAFTAAGTAGQVLTSDGVNPPYWSSAALGTVTSVAASGGTTGLTFGGSPITSSGTLTLGGTLAVASGGTGATNAPTARSNLGAAASGANSDITSLSGITGGIATADYLAFDTAATGVPASVGTVFWDGGQTLNVWQTANVAGKINEDNFYYIKATGAISKGQLVMFTGAVGASGVLTGAPATGLGINDGVRLMGVAAENIALNGFGLVQWSGTLRGLNTTGAPYGETWADGDILYYNPSFAGGLTKTEPTAPNVRAVIAAVVNAAPAGSGAVVIRLSVGSVLGGTDSNVYINALTGGDLLWYDGTDQRWENTAASTVTVGTATNIAGGAANRIAYQTNAGATGFIAAPTTANTFLEWNGSAFQWSSNPLGTVTSVNVSGGTTGLSFSGGPITTSGTITMAGTLAVANGGTGVTTSTGAGSVVLSTRPSFGSALAVGGATAAASGAGVTFPATQSASSDANTLDDYEEGTCTITIKDSLGNSATMGSGNSFRYVKIGAFVHVSGTLEWTSIAALTAGSRIRFDGLPFPVNSASNYRAPAIIGSSASGSFNITRAQIAAGADAGNSFIFGTKVSGNNVDGDMVPADLGSSGTVYGFQISYVTDF